LLTWRFAKSLTAPAIEILGRRIFGELPSAPGFPAVNTVSLGSLAPLPLGTHTVDVSWNLSALHCDGFTADPGASCLP
jgi:hypothetical protein